MHMAEEGKKEEVAQHQAQLKEICLPGDCINTLPKLQNEKSKEFELGNEACQEGRHCSDNVQKNLVRSMHVPRIRVKLAMLKYLDLYGGEATRKTINKTKISSLGNLGGLEVSLSVQGTFSWETGWCIPSSMENVSIQRPKGTLGLVRGRLNQGTNVGPSLL